MSTVNDTIFLTTGSYTQSTILGIPLGVSITGERKDLSILYCTYPTDMTLNFSSATLEAGNHNISYIGFDGSLLTGYRAISMTKRSGCKIYECDFKDFSFSSVKIANGGGFQNIRPAVYSTGCEFHDNTMSNAGST
jgi:hypothetical protein